MCIPTNRKIIIIKNSVPPATRSTSTGKNTNIKNIKLRDTLFAMTKLSKTTIFQTTGEHACEFFWQCKTQVLRLKNIENSLLFILTFFGKIQNFLKHRRRRLKYTESYGRCRIGRFRACGLLMPSVLSRIEPSFFYFFGSLHFCCCCPMDRSRF